MRVETKNLLLSLVCNILPSSHSNLHNLHIKYPSSLEGIKIYLISHHTQIQFHVYQELHVWKLFYRCGFYWPKESQSKILNAVPFIHKEKENRGTKKLLLLDSNSEICEYILPVA